MRKLTPKEQLGAGLAWAGFWLVFALVIGGLNAR